MRDRQPRHRFVEIEKAGPSPSATLRVRMTVRNRDEIEMKIGIEKADPSPSAPLRVRMTMLKEFLGVQAFFAKFAAFG